MGTCCVPYASDLVQAQSLLFRPWVLAAFAGAVAVALVEAIASTGFAGTAVALAGALAGVVLLPMITQLGLIAGAVVFGLRVRHVIFGAMREVASWTPKRVTFTVRALPITLRAQIGPWRSPVILRCWLAGLLSAVVGVAVVVGGWLLTDSAFWRGFTVAVTPLMLYKLWPQRVPLTTSTGWLLFSLPRLDGAERSEFIAAPLAARAYEALRRGEIDQAQSYADELAEKHPGLNATMSCQVSVLEARGEYAPGVLLLLKYLSENGDLPPRKMSYLLAGLAGLGFKAVEAGQLPAESLLPTAKKALEDAVKLGYPEFELSGSNALLALIEGDPESAVRLAQTGADYNHTPLSRADDLVTLARAHMACHDNAAAREALGKAEELAPWSPRVTETRQRLSVA
ncbi:hypothetical protein SAMN05421805_1011401 [Saccharopolyspora antimicrobica]|uniref:Tetratricopeptide repeat-containing protein n=1 Tax=Saccharopolyspora antimicrobica TaxID=455193 RepID=A0A1I4TE53_9PSEU|nr:hypothetical protein ATL45_4103 [Saccharopolyspora antimicrobica]SFM75058.1 hypothetical protein SAMN05421805_1011401 [Saccharopolyspora antimicrobica]